MKNYFKIVTGALSVFCLASCGNSVPKTDVTTIQGIGYSEKDYIGVTNLNITLEMGETEKIELDAMPKSYAPNVKFESKNEAVVKVSETGQLTPVSEGFTHVIVKDKDGKLISRVNVIVAKKDAENTARVIKNLSDAYGTGYVAPTRAHKFEYSYERYNREGNINHGYTSFEEEYYDKEKGIFVLSGDDIMRYSENGAREAGTGYWCFEVLGMSTRMVHITENVKNYFDFNSSAYGKGNEYRVIEDVLDLFFVSGKKIINDLLNDYSGLNDFLDSYEDKNVAKLADNDNDLLFSQSFRNQKNTVSIKNELEYFDMYEGTEYIENDDVEILFNSNKCAGFNVYSTYDYQFEGSNWQREFYRSMAFDDEYEPVIYDFTDKEMKDAGFFKVEQMYEL